MDIGAAIFGLFCLVLVIAGIGFVAAMASNSAPIEDTFGTTNPGNLSQEVAGAATSTGSASIVPLIILGAAVFLIVVIFSFYVYSKTFPH